MALFKIFKGSQDGFTNPQSDVYKNAVNGYCYFVEDTGKFYIDTGTGNPQVYRKVLNAEKAEGFIGNRHIVFSGDMTGELDADFTSDITVPTTVLNAAKVSNALSI